MKQCLLLIPVLFAALTQPLAQSTTFQVAVQAGDSCILATAIDSLLGGEVDVAQNSGLYDNTTATASEVPAAGFECFQDMDTDSILTNTQWFSFTGDGNIYEIRTSNCGAANPMLDNDSQLAVYSGSDCSNLTPVTCNEDEDGTQSIFNALVTVPTELGVTYYLMVDGWSGIVGEYCLTVTQIDPITCDDLLVANPITDKNLVCFNDTIYITLDGEIIVPTSETGLNGFQFLVHSEDVSNTENPFAEDSYLNAFGVSPVAYFVIAINNVDSLGLLPGTYFFTPVVYGGGESDFEGNANSYSFDNGCVSVGSSIEVTLLPEFTEVDQLMATATSTSEDEVEVVGGTASVTAGGGSGRYAFLWSTGDTTQTISDLSAGEYFVTVSDLSACVDDVVVAVVVDFVSSLNDPALSAAVKLYPNPATNAATFQYSFQKATDLTINVTNTLGQTLITKQVNSAQQGREVLEVGNLDPGTYFVRFSDGNRQAVKPLVIID